ncbi:tRNA(Ile)-lysidine synthase [Paenibacillus sp. UNCCL117]|uniref:tRNA lysidine(34) synthetase TilS n=1 Tax=unclassified Paenibacillus TaxID=185978 RepID=UPI000888219C|nr:MULTISPECIES: tRNA lysidine(34) synthetase TilS [unclassified Paenibacillus]SDE54201.1 tRNA(Ile)-lysidine synthase [Paenibacillus sp. cl123]SFW68157.1 tRNA(Ile)-lysidine synthase [Paenibacillus sp. UNCCL117]
MDEAWALRRKVERFIREESLLEQGDGVVVAVSGGPDSVALLHLLFALSEAWGWTLTAAHVDHGYRGAESAEEADFVRRLAAELGIGFRMTRLDMPGYLASSGGNSQAEARALRYEFLHETARELGARKLALAHHADDQAETVLMRMMRGTGLSGLRGIPLRRTERETELVRPLLRIYKAELIRYCQALSLDYRTDSSNLETKYFRNQIRLEVLPYLARYQEGLSESLNRLAETARAEDDLLHTLTLQQFDENVTVGNGIFSWSAEWFAGLHFALQRRLIKLILSYLAPDTDHADYQRIEQIRSAAVRPQAANFRLPLDSSLTLSREYDRVMLHTMMLPPVPYAYEIAEGQTELAIAETGALLHLGWFKGENAPTAGAESVWRAVFDAVDMSFPLRVRSRLPGDRMSVYGLNGSKKVKDIFIDAKVPVRLRERIPIVEDAQGRILWLPGVRRSSLAMVREESEHKLVLELQPDFNLQ